MRAYLLVAGIFVAASEFRGENENRHRRILDLAPYFFPMNGTKIALPPDTSSIVVDVGARYSKLFARARGVCTHGCSSTGWLEKAALVLFEPHHPTYAVLAKEIHGDVAAGGARRFFALPAAVAEQWGTATFNVGHVGACGSLLKTSATNKFWCAETKDRRVVPTLPLAAILSILPGWLPWRVLKIDAEGYDLGVARSGHRLVSRFEVVLMECQDLDETTMELLMRENGCVVSEAKAYMGTLGFDHAKFQEAGKDNKYRQGDITFAKSAEALDHWVRNGERLKGESKPKVTPSDEWGHGT